MSAAAQKLDRVLDRLGYNGTRNQTHYLCHCPAHPDSKASLSVSAGEDGRVLLFCHAGCPTPKVLAAVGLTFIDLGSEPQPKQAPQSAAKAGPTEKPKTSAALGTAIAYYDYRDAAGTSCYQVVRYDPKDFRQRRPDGKDGWIWNLRGVTRLLYRLPELLSDDLDLDRWVFVVEGEKDVDRLRQAKLVATCNAQGAGKWESSFNIWLADRRVCILPDNDEPGRKHAHLIAGQLTGLAKQVRLLELPGLPPKGDVSDWLDAGGTPEQLLALVEATPDYIAPLPQPTVPATNGNGRHPAPGEDLAGLLLDHAYHDDGNAEVTLALHPNRFAYCHELGWLVNQSGFRRAENAEFEVNRAITRTLKRRRMAAVEAEREDLVKATTPTSGRKNAVKDMFRDLVVVSLSEFDNDPDVLNCVNGVIDLRSGELVAHEASNRFTYCVNTPFDTTANRNLWLSFLAGSVGDYDDIAAWLQMAVGYSLTGKTREECLFYVEGPTRSGKGTAMQTLLTLLGHPLACGVDFTTFTKRREGDSQNFDLAMLRPARLISASESGRYTTLNEAVVKSITGNDPVTAAFKHRDMFTYTPQFKIWLSSNHPAKGDVDDDAFWGRIRVIRFPNSHVGSEDKTLKWRMSTPEHLPGVLAWAVEGARRWYAAPQGLVTPFAIHKATQQHRSELDHIQQWLEECTVPEPNGVVTNQTLYTAYTAWCEENGHVARKARMFGRSLVIKGFEACQKRIGDRMHRAYRGLQLRSVLPDLPHAE